MKLALALGGVLLGGFALLLITAAAFMGGGGLQPGVAYASPSGTAVADIPPEILLIYRAAGEKYGLDWAVLAAIGSIETNHGQSSAPGVKSGVNSFGCCAGPMQFSLVGSPSTWDSFGVDGNGDGRKSVYDPRDAIPAAANYLKASGAPGDWQRAIFAYNHAQWYVDDVLRLAERYRSAPERTGGDVSGSGGAKGIVDALAALAAREGGEGVYVGSDYREGSTTSSGNMSDHASNDANAAARDIGVRGIDLIVGPPSPKLDRACQAIVEKLGGRYAPGTRIVENFHVRGFRVQVIWHTPEYGGHMGHIHVGARRER